MKVKKKNNNHVVYTSMCCF